MIDFGSGAVLHNGIYTDYDGTACYAAPEWVTCRRYFGLPQTVWSLGILLYDLICGDIPFLDDLSIIKCQPNFPDNISSGKSNKICFPWVTAGSKYAEGGVKVQKKMCLFKMNDVDLYLISFQNVAN